MTRSIIDVIGRERALELMRLAVQEAVAENRRLGLPDGPKIDRKGASETLQADAPASGAASAPAVKKSVLIV